ncbi:MAG: LytTR family transcriptional regulator DNA-binding domain-containing protein [Clostridia bacterium]|nr:LytTR family transcriptional regulator DNA-binding domain-containing protein [Clostridia bacterium]
MDIKIIIDKNKSEEILIYAREKTELIEEIEKIVLQSNKELVGYKDNEAKKPNLFNVNCFISESNKVFALTDEKLQVKLRLYQLEEILDESFIKINQSCIANIRQIEKVQGTFSGAISVIFKNGYKDYISRRNLKNVKERLGIKL